jgi:hypothetical protein
MSAQTRLPEAWPRLLSRSQSAAYCGISESAFARICPVAPLDLGMNVIRYNRRQLDAWIDGLPPRLRREQLASQDEIARLAEGAHQDAAAAAAEERRNAALARVERRAEQASGRQSCKRSATSSA